MDALVRVKDARLNIVKDSLGLFKNREADTEWTIKKKSNKYTKVKAWDKMDLKCKFRQKGKVHKIFRRNS